MKVLKSFAVLTAVLLAGACSTAPGSEFVDAVKGKTATSGTWTLVFDSNAGMQAKDSANPLQNFSIVYDSAEKDSLGGFKAKYTSDFIVILDASKGGVTVNGKLANGASISIVAAF